MTDTASAKASRSSAKLIAYVADRDVYVDHIYVKAGDVFATDKVPSVHWKRVTAKDAAASGAAS